jgi:hypothetical protein
MPKLLTLKINPAQIEGLATIGCTNAEIAALAGCCVSTLQRRHGDDIRAARARGNTSLRRWQWQAAESGKVTMLIWLGRHRLRQRDKNAKAPSLESLLAAHPALADAAAPPGTVPPVPPPGAVQDRDRGPAEREARAGPAQAGAAPLAGADQRRPPAVD